MARVTRRTADEVIALLNSDTPLDNARKKFHHWSAKIEQAGLQRTPLSPVEHRRMEFEAVEEIVAAYNTAPGGFE